LSRARRMKKNKCLKWIDNPFKKVITLGASIEIGFQGRRDSMICLK